MRAERVFAHANRLVRSAMSLELLPAEQRAAPAAAAWLRQCAEGVNACARYLDGARDVALPPPPDVPSERLILQRLADALRALQNVLQPAPAANAGAD